MQTPVSILPRSQTALGCDLTPADQRHVLAAFVYRYTAEHRPSWTARQDCQTCPVQFASDADWLANTRFAVRKNGRLNHNYRSCDSSPTWPNNPELRRKAS